MAAQSRIIADRYELTAPISQGGMGQVWRGYDTILDRDIAVKLIRPELADTDESREELIGRFRREARVTAKVEHPGVPAVYDAAFDAGADRLYLVMQLVHGMSLADVVAEKGALSTAWTASIGAQICAVLSYAHAVPIVHRDLKPGNVMLARDGRVKVLDFGIAAVLRSGVTKLTSTGRLVGTKPYMSPEQIQNGPITPQSDLYALGCLLHEILSGKRVYEADDEIALMYQHLEGSPTPLRRIVPGVPADIEGLVLDLLAKRPVERPGSAWEVYDRLVPFLPITDPGAVDIEPAPGNIPDPTRPFRTPAAPRPRPALASAALPETTPSPGIDKESIDRAVQQAADLVDGDRFTQASDLLAEVIPQASERFGAESDGVIDLRINYAVSLFLGGDFRRAVPEFDSLAAIYARRVGETAEETLEFRRQAAISRIELGDTPDSVAELERIASAYEVLGSGFERVAFDLRLDVVRLQILGGDLSTAEESLRVLRAAVNDVFGADDRLLTDIDEIEARLTMRYRTPPPEGSADRG